MENEKVKVDLAEYKKEDFKKVSWREYGKTLEALFKKVNSYINKNNIKIDAVIPILRGGAFPGTYLLFKLNLLRMLPIQYKYFFKNGEIHLKRILEISKYIQLPSKPTLLLVENNQCFGLTATTAAQYLKERFPDCKIIYAIDHQDYSYQKFDIFDIIFYGKLTNETKKINEEECKKVGIENCSYLFPWENLEEEFTTVQGKQFKYKDLDNIDIK